MCDAIQVQPHDVDTIIRGCQSTNYTGGKYRGIATTELTVLIHIHKTKCALLATIV